MGAAPRSTRGSCKTFYYCSSVPRARHTREGPEEASTQQGSIILPVPIVNTSVDIVATLSRSHTLKSSPMASASCRQVTQVARVHHPNPIPAYGLSKKQLRIAHPLALSFSSGSSDGRQLRQAALSCLLIEQAISQPTRRQIVPVIGRPRWDDNARRLYCHPQLLEKGPKCR